jgi:hypothetical protein
MPPKVFVPIVGSMPAASAEKKAAGGVKLPTVTRAAPFTE